jgi:FKBP-type peptidyl-prolyl cis-trans isomerase
MNRLLLASLALPLAALALPPAGGADRPGGKKYALLVGVKEYNHDKLSDLKYTENDVEELAKLLRKESAGFTEVTVLTNARGKKAASARPTAANIRTRLKRILARVGKRDTVLVALSGHGLQLPVADPKGKKKDKEEGFFCPSDARIIRSRKRAELMRTLIPFQELFDALEDSGAGVKLLLVDACRNELPSGEKSIDADSVPRPPRGFAALFSCAAGQKSHETAKLGEKGHGLFFHFVLKGLQGEAKNEDREVTWDDLMAYVKRRVPRAAVKVVGEGAQQSPHLVSNLVNSPVLVRPSSASELPRTVTTASGLRYQDLKLGSGAAVTDGDTVEVHYTGWLDKGGGTRGKQFGSSLDGKKPFRFKVGENVIAGFREGVVGMKPGGKRLLMIPAKLGYGARGASNIPSNTDLLFEVELLK